MDICERRQIFLSNIRAFDDGLLKVKNIQNEYREGKIKEEDLSLKQKEALYKLYDMQITNLKKSNDIKKSTLLKNISNITQNSLDWSEIMLESKLENGKIKISELSNNELDKMIEHYKRKNKTKENILKMKRKKLNDSK